MPKALEKQQKNIGTHINRALTNVSVAYMQDQNMFIADKVFPIIPVKKQSDVYFIYNRGDWFRDEMTDRAAGSESAGTEYGVESSTPYYCKKKSLHYDITEEERANSDDPLMPDTDATEFLSQKGLIHKEKRWADHFFKTDVWGTDVAGVASNPTGDQVIKWSDKVNSNPIDDIQKYITDMASVTGMKANTLVLAPDVFTAIKQNEVVLDRIKYTQRGVVTTDILASLFEVENIYVAWGVINSAKKGAAESNNFVMSGSALLMYVEKNPGIKKPSAGYTFAWTGLLGAGAYGNRIRKFPMPALGEGTDRVEIDNAFDHKVVGADLGVFFHTLL